MRTMLFAALPASVIAFMNQGQTFLVQEMSKGITKHGRHLIGLFKISWPISMGSQWPV